VLNNELEMGRKRINTLEGVQKHKDAPLRGWNYGQHGKYRVGQIHAGKSLNFHHKQCQRTVKILRLFTNALELSKIQFQYLK
jgi:hypothetical protein